MIAAVIAASSIVQAGGRIPGVHPCGEDKPGKPGQQARQRVEPAAAGGSTSIPVARAAILVVANRQRVATKAGTAKR